MLPWPVFFVREPTWGGWTEGELATRNGGTVKGWNDGVTPTGLFPFFYRSVIEVVSNFDIRISDFVSLASWHDKLC